MLPARGPLVVRVLLNLAIDGLHAKGHLGRLVDEDDLAVLRRQDVEISVGHGFFLQGG